MPTVNDVLLALEKIAPQRFAFSFDKVGLQVGDPESEVQTAIVSLDSSQTAAEFAMAHGAQLLVAHHPLIFDPATAVTATTRQGRTILALARAGISFIAAHTNWDSARGGINDRLVEMLDIREVFPFGTGADVPRLKVAFTAPAEAAPALVAAASAAGAGIIGEYSECSFSSNGTGSFVPSSSAKPFVGAKEKLNSVDEVRVEMNLPAVHENAVATALLQAHPYEAAVIDFYALTSDIEQAAGRIGVLNEPVSLADLASRVGRVLETPTQTWGDPKRSVRRVAVVGGAADGEWAAAQRAGADVLITGEVRQHNAVDASESGMCLIAAGHYATEHPGCAALRDRLAAAVADVDWLLHEPEPGRGGRPF